MLLGVAVAIMLIAVILIVGAWLIIVWACQIMQRIENEELIREFGSERCADDVNSNRDVYRRSPNDYGLRGRGTSDNCRFGCGRAGPNGPHHSGVVKEAE